MTIAVVIPAHNEADFIEQILTTVRAQTRLPDELLVVCDRCTDDTATRATDAFAGFPPGICCDVLTADVGDIAGARNAGIRVTGCEVVVCLDADTLLAPNVLEEVEKAVLAGTVLGGFHLIPDRRYRRSFGQALLNRIWISSINLCALTLKNFVGTGCFFRRDTNLLYNESWGWGEDIEFCNRLKRTLPGCRCRYLSEATLVYCDRRFIERGYARELVRRLGNGLDHLRRWRSS